MKAFMAIILIIMLFAACSKDKNPTIINGTLATPSISPESGTYASPKLISVVCSSSGAQIRYTLDGSEPTEESALYVDRIEVDSTLTVKARAYKEGWNPSSIASMQYRFEVASLFIIPMGGAFLTPQTVQIAPTSAGTIIHYTTDGTEPTTSSPLYSAPLLIDRTMNLKAKGFIAGWTSCPTVSVNFTFQVEQPTFNLVQGTYYNTINVVLSSPTEGSVVRYTTNGTEPSETSAIYSSPVSITANTNIKAKAYKTNWTPSSTSTAEYVLKVTAPALAPAPGSFFAPQNVKITCPTSGTTIYYTTNGAAPTTSSAVYSEPIPVAASTVIKAIAVKTGWNTSNVVTGNYELKVYAPKFSLPGGQYGGTQIITMSCATPNAEIRYTIDNTNPEHYSPLYNSSISLNANTILKAKAFKPGYTTSTETMATYLFENIVSNPVFSVSGGEYHEATTVAITCATPGATIHYSLDNSIPSPLTPEYTHPFVLHSNTVIKAKAYYSDWVPSQVVTAEYFIYVPIEMISIAGGTYMMGDTHGLGFNDAVPTHLVTLSPYAISNFEITQQEWVSVMGYNPSYHTGNIHNPVDQVSTFACMVYCNKKSIQDGLTPVYSINSTTNPDNWGPIPTTMVQDWKEAYCNISANGYRLPTEAEWEYAARGGSVNPDYNYSGGNDLYELGWYSENGIMDVHPVGQKQGNALGLYDMSGNIREWCWDWYSAYYYGVSPANNPTGPNITASNADRVIRGGCYMDSHTSCMIQSRGMFDANQNSSYIGFRIVKSLIGR